MGRMKIIRRIVIALLLTVTAAGCARPQASVFRLAPLAVSWVRGPTAPRVPVCSWLGIVVDNAIPARPQWGLSEADVVYEVPTEGMITRFLALFCGDGPDTVGPVRSLRLQFLDIAGDYSATVAHAGSSESALAAVEEHAGPVINEFWNAGPFRRDQHRHRPHNVFASVALLRRYVKDTSPLGTRPWTTTDLTPAATPMMIAIPYGRGYTSQFVFDPASGHYRRFTEGQRSVDALTGHQIEVAAVIVLYARWWQVYEGPVLTSRMALTGEGRITVFAAGRRFDGTWRRPDSSQRTVFADAEGRPIQLPPGRVWISVVPPERVVRVDYVGTEPRIR
ncbi:MAG: DUF3048 domain-containing protein [Bacillati bacterium ANGP1]|uniref:DUF3048 domain-containing protein n=1 Tax=Candidatus Segetimicrobium genomatis TaxID=2569760 RepID=A0A537LF73_9BACT|nr:MAG: DUF3048 domain-containing protein [Terrabacteria group bacterium ANGP1]